MAQYYYKVMGYKPPRRSATMLENAYSVFSFQVSDASEPSEEMSSSRSGNRRDDLPDEFPPRPRDMMTDELAKVDSAKAKKETWINLMLGVTYFLYGMGSGVYGPIYPLLAKNHGFSVYEYGPVMTIQYLVALLFYPLACNLIGTVSYRHAMSTGALIIGICKCLFGSMAGMISNSYFIGLSYAIQVMEGVGFGVLLATTVSHMFSQDIKKAKLDRDILCTCFILGVSFGPIGGEALFKVYYFSSPFLGIGTSICLMGSIMAFFLPEPVAEERLSFKDFPFVSWMKTPRMLIYFLVVFSAFCYLGFLIVTLEPFLKQFHLDLLCVGVFFSIPTFCIAAATIAWGWLARKGVNSVFLIVFSCFVIMTSFLLIGNPPFTRLQLTLGNVTTALFFCGIGAGGKLACIIYTARRDMRSRVADTEVQELLMIATIVGCGALFGLFSGSIIGGYAYVLIGMENAMYILLGIELLTVVVTFVFAFKRNYRSPRHLDAVEQNPIMSP